MQKLFGGILIGCGILIAGVSGLCMLMLGGMYLTEFSGDMAVEELITMIPQFVIFIGIPIGVGIGLFFLGRQVMRQADAAEQAQSSEDRSDTFK